MCVDVFQWLLDGWCRIDRDSGQPVWLLNDRVGRTDTRGLWLQDQAAGSVVVS